MIQHIVVIGTSYKLGKRIGLHFSGKVISQEWLDLLQKKTKDMLGNSAYAMHRLVTVNESWQSVVEKDSFFEDIDIYEDIDEFLKILKNDKKITVEDIAKLVLTIQPMTHLKLQKMIYFIYERYLLETGKKLFEEKIIAYPYGPVIKEVYDKYKKYGRTTISNKEDDSHKLEFINITYPMAVARIYKEDDAINIFATVHKVFDDYGDMTASQLVELSHKKDGPWTKTKLFDEIKDEIIIQCS